MDYKNLAFKYILPAVALLLLSTIAFYPQLQNKSVNSSDTTEFQGMYNEIRQHHKETGERSWWTNSMFGGMPAFQISASQPSNMLQYVDKFMHLLIDRPIGLFFLIMLCAYISLLLFKSPPWVSFFGAAVIGLSVSNFILFGSGHMTKLKTIGYCIPLFMGLYLAYEKNRKTGIALYGISLGLALLCNHPQMLYYMLFSLVVYGVIAFVSAIQDKRLLDYAKTTGGLVLISLIALASSASKILPTLEYSKDSMRGTPLLTTSNSAGSKSSAVEGLDWEYATNWSNGWVDVFASIIPGAAGGSSIEPAPNGSQTIANFKKRGQNVPANMKLPLYWGDLGSFTGGAFYLGIALLFLIMVQFMAGDKKLSLWLCISLLLLLLLSMGRHMAWFNRPLFDYLPLFNKFRTPNSVSSIASALVGLGAAFGLHTLVTSEWDRKRLIKAVVIAAIPLALLCLFFAFAGSPFFDFVGLSFFDFSHAQDAAQQQRGFNVDDLVADRQLLMRNDALRSLMYLALSTLAAWLFASGKMKSSLLIGAITVISLLDITGIGRRYLPLDHFKANRSVQQEFTKRPVDEQILKVEKNRGAYRVLDQSMDTYNSARTSYWHNTVGGYHPAKLQRFEDIKNVHLYKGTQAVYDMLNTKYVITRDQKLQQNPGAMGTSWFVNNIQNVTSNDEEILSLSNFLPKETAVIHQDFAEKLNGLQPTGQGTISMTDYAPNRIVYQSQTSSEELAIFSEVWYGPNKGWIATIDGQKTDVLRANYLLRALRVPAGSHEIVFEFDSSTMKIGNLITLISSLLLIGFIGFLIHYTIKTSRASIATTEQGKLSAKKVGQRAQRKKKKK